MQLKILSEDGSKGLTYNHGLLSRESSRQATEENRKRAHPVPSDYCTPIAKKISKRDDDEDSCACIPSIEKAVVTRDSATETDPTMIWKNSQSDPMRVLHKMMHHSLQNFVSVPNLVEIANIFACNAYFQWLDKLPERHPGHVMILGNPGVGKTTGARALSSFLVSAGIVKSSAVIEAHRDDLVDRYVGATEAKTSELIKSAGNGIIIFDEIYMLNKPQSPNDFGKEALSTIMKHMIKENGPLFMFLGYKDEMMDFLKMNRGLQRRIKHTVEMPDYDAKALAKIAFAKLQRIGLKLQEDLPLHKYFAKLPREYLLFLNATAAMTLVDLAHQQARSRALKLPHHLRTGVATNILREDFDKALRILLDEIQNNPPRRR